ncbi:MAG: helix-turn-helix transcriptional regulator [Archangiaceae bacterium]|nr:helix-turn-helix transcriptional regulator [Archangiaceae bacterium]
MAEPEARLAELDAVFSALAHRARRQILMTLHFRGGSMAAGDIAGRFAHAWPTTTRHLKVLEEAGLVTVERKGLTRLYRLEPKNLEVVTGWMKWLKSAKG